MTGTTERPREILVVAHARREDTVAAARRVQSIQIRPLPAWHIFDRCNHANGCHD